MVVVSVKQPRWVETQLKSPAKGKVVLWRLRLGQEDDQCGTQQAMERGFGASNGWSVA